jgi:hypothetical protein
MSQRILTNYPDRLKSASAFGPRESRKHSPIPSNNVIVETHQYVFGYLGKRFASDIRGHLIYKPQRIRKEFFQSLGTGQRSLVTRELLFGYLGHLEMLMRDILSTHSPFFWMFLCRRIKPSLAPEHDNATDELTTLLVRNIVDLAISKYGNVDVCDDVKPATQMTLGKSWGGVLSEAIGRLPNDTKEQILPALLKEFESGETFLPLNFKSTNYRDIFEVEGLGYEYWLATARLRSVGKGSRIFFDKTTSEFIYESDADLDLAIERFDRRLGSTRILTTLIGVTVSARGDDQALKTIATLQYNVGSQDVSPILQALGYDVRSVTTAPIGNFIPLFISIENLQKSHSYLNQPFERRWGFTFEQLVWFLWALSNLALVPNRYLSKKGHPLGYYLLHLLQRGHALNDNSGDKTFGALRERWNDWLKLDPPTIDRLMERAPIIFEMLSLSAAKQGSISLWSGGPRSVVVAFTVHSFSPLPKRCELAILSSSNVLKAINGTSLRLARSHQTICTRKFSET